MTDDTIHKTNKSITSLSNILLDSPTPSDGTAIHQLIANCPPLDTNSLYCNLLQCFHFADTAIVAKAQGEVVGFISGYRLPKAPNTLFVWQVAVAQSARGLGLASAMLNALLARQGAGLSHLHTTITEANTASWNTFRRLARELNAPFTSHELFNQDAHLGGAHASEHLIHIGPFALSTLE